MNTPFPQLTTHRLSLKQFLAADLKYIYAGLSHPQVVRYYGVSYQTLEETKKQLHWFQELESSGTGRWWALWSAGNANFLGAAGFNNLSQTHRKVELGFWLLPEYWGNGFTSEALEAVLAYGFEQLGLHRIEAFVECGNEKSSRVLLKQGFRHEGTQRDCEIKHGHFISLQTFAKLSSD